MKSNREIQQQLDFLYRERSYWSQQAEQAIKRQDFQSRAATNSDHILSMCRTLEWVLNGKPFPPVYEDNGNAHVLTPD